MSKFFSIVNLVKEYFLLNWQTIKLVFLVCSFIMSLFIAIIMLLFATNKNGISFFEKSLICITFGIVSSITIILIAFINSCYYFIKTRWFHNKTEWKSFIKNNNLKITMLHTKWYFSEECLIGKIRAFPARIHINPYNFTEAECFYFIEMKELNKQELKYYQKQFEEQDAFFHIFFILKKFNFYKNDGAYDLQIQLEEFANYLAVCNCKPIQLEEVE